jgi:hypothetical protein
MKTFCIMLIILSTNSFASIDAIKLKVKEKQKSEEKCLFYSQIEEDKISIVLNYLNSEKFVFFQQGQNLLVSFSKENDSIVRKLINNNELIKTNLGDLTEISNENSKFNKTLKEHLFLLNKMTSRCK